VIDTAAATTWRAGVRAQGLVERSACRILRRLAARVPADQAIVELGAFRGRSTGWLLAGAQRGHGAHVTTVDPWETRTGDYVGQVEGTGVAAWEAFQAHMTRVGATDAELTVIRGYAAEVAAGWRGPVVGLLWHDAGHGADEVATDLAAWVPHIAPAGVVVLHDVCNPLYGVAAGAARVLDSPGWDWPGRRRAWSKHADRRGVLIVRRRP
jgi:hypothetical protein